MTTNQLCYAHSLPECSPAMWQPLEAHLANVSLLAGAFAEVFGGRAWAELAGLLHDVGKSSVEFQQRLHGSRRRVDHSTAGVQLVHTLWGTSSTGKPDRLGELFARLLGYVLAGHHGGLPDAGATSLDAGSLTERQHRTIPVYRADCVTLPPVTALGMPPVAELSKKAVPFALSLFVRMVFSCLVDADFLDTERFCNPHIAALRQPPVAIGELAQRLRKALEVKGFLVADPVTAEEMRVASSWSREQRMAAICRARQGILQWCLAAAHQPPGVFSLTVPTGGGKTFSSLAFALEHARQHGLHRVILVVPYTSIIEQNAEEFRKVLGDDVVLEHHCSYVHPDLEGEGDTESETAKAYRLSTENWDATVIVTTAVQFFESLFANGVSACRKLHRISKSVIILDEAQMLPLALLKPTLAALKELVRAYGSSLVLCTATQPALTSSTHLPQGLEPVQEIIPQVMLPALFALYRRVDVTWCGKLSLDALATHLAEREQVLCIVNSRRRARELYALLKAHEGVFHLSSLMTPAHRTTQLDAIRQRLQDGKPCRVVSTSLVECGVDISFSAVWREESGLDAIAQAAGRCNRHGEFERGLVTVFQSEEGFSRMQGDLQRRATVCRRLCHEEADCFAPDTVHQYFSELYAEAASLNLLDEKHLLTLCAHPEGRFPFREIDRAYRFIDNDMRSVIIESDAVRDLVARLRSTEPVPFTTLRRLQRHTVSLYAHEVRQLQQDGRLVCLRQRFWVLSGGLGYDEHTGLNVRLDAGFNPLDLLY